MRFSRARRHFLVLASAAGHPALHAQPAPPVVAQQVSPSAWYVQGESALGSPANRNFISNAGFVVTPAGVVVIDALGSPALARELMEEIRRRTGKPVTHVVLTHYHADHIYGLQEFKRAGAKVIAHRSALEYLHSQTAQSRLEVSRRDLAPWIDARTQLVPADQWVDGPLELGVGGMKLLLQPVGPAHTPEDLVVYLPAEKVLWTADITIVNPNPTQLGTLRSAVAAFDRLNLDYETWIPAHPPNPDRRLTRADVLAAVGR